MSQTLWSSVLIPTGKMTLLLGESKYLRGKNINKNAQHGMKNWDDISKCQFYSLNWAPLVFLISPKMAAFPHQISQGPPDPSLAAPSPPPPSSFPHVFLKAEICFSSAGSRANRLSFPCRRQISSNSVPFTFLLQEFSAQLPSWASAQCGSSQALSHALTWWNPLTKRNGVWCLTNILSLPSKQNNQMCTATLAWSPVPPGFRLVRRTTFPACYTTTCRSVELSSWQRLLQWRSTHVLRQKSLQWLSLLYF